MRRARIITTALFIFGLATLLSYPMTVGVPPKKSASFVVRKQYATRLTIFFSVASFALLGAAIGAILIARDVRQKFAEQALQNLADLLTAEVEAKKKDA